MGSEAGRFPTDFHATETGTREVESDKLPYDTIEEDYDLSCDDAGCTLTIINSVYVTDYSWYGAFGLLKDKMRQTYRQYRIFRDDGGRTMATIEETGGWVGPVKLSSEHAFNMLCLAVISNALLDMEQAGEGSEELSDLRKYIDNIPRLEWKLTIP